MEFVGRSKTFKLVQNNSLAEWVVHVHRFVDGKPHVRNVGCNHTWACLWSQHIRGCNTLLQKSTPQDFFITHTTTSKTSTCRTIPTLSSWFKCLSSKQQKQQLVLERNKGTDIHTALHAVANCALSNEQTTFSDSLISEHADPYHAHKSNNESMSNSKIKMNYDLNAEETRMFAPFGETCCITNASPFLGWPLQSSK